MGFDWVAGGDGDAGEAGFCPDGDGAAGGSVFFGVVADLLDEFVEGGLDAFG